MRLLESYLLSRDLKPTTAAYYRRSVQVLETWAGKAIDDAEFTAELCSRFLADKQAAGRSSHYRKSLRNALRALLRHAGRQEALRPVRIEQIDPEVWRTAEIARLVRAVECLPERERPFWKTLILAGWHTGLNQIDLLAVPRSAIDDFGVVRWRRSKTGVRITTKLPAALLEEIDAWHTPPGPIWRWTRSQEWFRRQFRRIAKAAELVGTFKKLRKSSGTAAEKLRPGAGHLHLGNSRRVFEQHYLSQAELDPVAIPEVV